MTRHVLVGLALLACGATSMAAAGRRPTCGIVPDRALDLHTSPLVALLELHLAQSKQVVLVERAQVDQVIQEQKLQFMFAPEAVRERAALGQLLKADLLVLMRANDKPQPHVHVVICETRQGLRLCARPVPLTDDPESDCAAVAALVDQAVALHTKGIKDVVAVPPFVDRSLTYQAEHLKAAYAKLVEDLAVLRPGVLVVELAEANAISREIALSASADVQRPLPLYVLGEYRQEGVAGQARQTVSLTLMRGRKQRDTAKRQNLSPREAPLFIRQATTAMLEKSLGKAPPPDPKAETRQLVDLGTAFLRMGDWSEAAALLQAAILLDERHPEWHRQAAFALQRMARDLQARDQAIFTKNTERAIACFGASLPHIETFFRNSALTREPHEMTAEGGQIQVRWVWGNWQRRLIAEMGERALRAADQLDQECLEMMNRVLRSKAARQIQDTTPLFAERICFRPLNYGMPLAERVDELQRRLAFLRQFAYLEDVAVCKRLVDYVARWGDLAPDDPDFTAFLEKAGTVKNAAMRQAVLHHREAAEKQAALDQARCTTLAATAPERQRGRRTRSSVRLVPLDVRLHNSQGSDVPVRFPISYWLAMLDGTDLICGEAQVYVMGEPGRLVPSSLVRTKEQVFPVVDGRLAWVVSGFPQPGLSAVDASSGDLIAQFTEADGLPPCRRAHVAPLEPGKVVVAGYFGRSFCGIAAVDPRDGTKSFKILYEARDAYDDMSLEHQKSPTVATEIDFLRVLTRSPSPGATPVRRAVIGRSAGAHPLLLDLDTASVQVLPYRMLERDILAVRDGAIYWTSIGREGLCLRRAALPDMQEEVLAKRLPASDDLSIQDWQSHVPEWRTQPDGEADARPPDVSAAILNEHHGVGVFLSARYGWVMPTHEGRVFQVVPQASAAASLPEAGAEDGPPGTVGGAP